MKSILRECGVPEHFAIGCMMVAAIICAVLVVVG